MEPLRNQYLMLRKKLDALPTTMRLALFAGLGLAALAAALTPLMNAGMDRYAYVYTNLSAEDGTEAAVTLRAAGIPFRAEANGGALAVPQDRVFDARILLATAGIPRAGGVGFELFDKGDLGVSQFTQKVNLRRALEGELARTVASLTPVAQARVHLTLPETSLHKEDDREAAAAVVVNLKAGMTLSTRELAGLRHLVAAAVPGLKPNGVHVVDGTGAVLAGGDDAQEESLAQRRKLERELERRVTELLEPIVGAGRVLARATVEMDNRRTDVTQEAFDPDSAVVRSERLINTSQSGSQSTKAGVAGAAANQPLQPTGPSTPNSNQQATNNDETRNYEVSRTTTVTRRVSPTLARQSVAVLLDEKALRSVDELPRLTSLVRSAVGFQEARGDRVELMASVFTVAQAAEPPVATPAQVSVWVLAAVAAGVGLLAILALVAVVRRRRARSTAAGELIRPGQRVADAEILLDAADGAPTNTVPNTGATVEGHLTTPEELLAAEQRALAERVQMLVLKDPERAAMVVRAWLTPETRTTEVAHGG